MEDASNRCHLLIWMLSWCLGSNFSQPNGIFFIETPSRVDLPITSRFYLKHKKTRSSPTPVYSFSSYRQLIWHNQHDSQYVSVWYLPLPAHPFAVVLHGLVYFVRLLLIDIMPFACYRDMLRHTRLSVAADKYNKKHREHYAALRHSVSRL